MRQNLRILATNVAINEEGLVALSRDEKSYVWSGRIAKGMGTGE